MLMPHHARANSPPLCYLTWTLPNGETFSPFGATRSGSRKVPWHAGVDVCMPVGTPVPVIQGAASASDATAGKTQKCHIIPGSKGPLHNTDPNGYGMYTRYDCGNGVEVFMAHLHGFSGNIPAALSGQEGNACAGASGPHVHLEVIIDQQVVDPQCVFGLVKGPYHGKPQGPGNAHTDQCKGVLGAGGAVNLCDAGIRAALKEDGRNRVPITRYPKAASFPAENYPGSYGEPQCKKPAKEVSCKIDHSKVPDPTKPNEWTGDPNYNTDEGTLLIQIPNGDPYTGLVSIPPGDPGDPGGELTPGKDEKPAELPPILPSDVVEPTTSCAVDTWVALNNQAALEGRRETAMQRRFIAKADSVIDYGCLPFYLKKTETVVASIFSETDAWVNRPVDIIGKTHTMNKTMGAMSMDSSLLNVIWTAHEEYKKNFAHPLLGGLEGVAITPDGSKCQDMQQVWDAARCQNFPAPDTAFPRFSDLISNDPRQFPSTMACSSTAINQGMIDAAKNQATKYDKVKPKLDYLAGDKDCKDPIATGITIHRFEPAKDGGIAKIKTYDDGICSNTGCSYDNPDFEGAGTCKKD